MDTGYAKEKHQATSPINGLKLQTNFQQNEIKGNRLESGEKLKSHLVT